MCIVYIERHFLQLKCFSSQFKTDRVPNAKYFVRGELFSVALLARERIMFQNEFPAHTQTLQSGRVLLLTATTQIFINKGSAPDNLQKLVILFTYLPF